MVLFRVAFISTYLYITSTIAIIRVPFIRAFSPLARKLPLGARYLFTNPPEEDLLKWETMYTSGDKGDDDSTFTNISPNQIRVVTFDLDNTLWKTGPTISAANDALAKFLDEKNILQPQRVEVIMGELFERSKSTYAPVAGEQATSPVLLTQLRTDALEFVLLQHNEYSAEAARTLAEQSFAVWTNARHDAITSHLADSVVETLQKIRTLESTTGRPVLIGAITDGNSDPRKIPILAEYFDFCVNAEGVGVSKPARKVYLAAAHEASTHEYVQDIFDPYQPNVTDDMMEDIIGPWWVHIGDDFVKDIVAAKDLGMRSVWCRELISKPKDEPAKEEQPSTTVEDFVKRISGMKEIKMTIGGGDYLATTLQREFADSVIDTFAALHQILDDWHQEGSQKTVPTVTEAQPEDSMKPTSENLPLQPIEISTESQDSVTAEKKKFCIACGTALPITAKFCVSCGEKMP